MISDYIKLTSFQGIRGWITVAVIQPFFGYLLSAGAKFLFNYRGIVEAGDTRFCVPAMQEAMLARILADGGAVLITFLWVIVQRCGGKRVTLLSALSHRAGRARID